MAKTQEQRTVMVEQMDSPGELIGTAAAAQELGVSQATLRRWLKEGRVEGRKVGKQWRFRRGDLGSVVDVQETSSAAPVPRAAVNRSERAIDALLAGRGMAKARIRKLANEIQADVRGHAKDSHPAFRRLVAKLLLNAVHAAASDLHIEPMTGSVKVRQRIDGVLTEVAELPLEVAEPLIDEIKRWTALDPQEKSRSQDGRAGFKVEGREIDFRINALPTIHGQVVAMRILDRQAALLPMNRLGFEPHEFERYQEIIQRPNGLVLVTGPTGSGKTTTLYATLCELNDVKRKIMTAEDPVELTFEGMAQTPIRPDIGMGFSQVTRAMLRQAPNIIFVGEIRDAETGGLLCQAALTGHLVFSTLHTDDAISAPIRMIDIGVKPFLIGSSVQCVVAQRLVRLICKDCKRKYRPKAKELDSLGLKGSDRKRAFHRGKGCKQCGSSGYKGRTAVYELLEFTRDVQQALHKNDPDELAEAAGISGWRPLREVALDKLFRGETSIEEVVRETCIPGRAAVI